MHLRKLLGERLELVLNASALTLPSWRLPSRRLLSQRLPSRTLLSRTLPSQRLPKYVELDIGLWRVDDRMCARSRSERVGLKQRVVGARGRTNRRHRCDLITSPAYILLSAKDRFQHPTRRVNELWQTDFTYFRVIGWDWYYLSTVLDDYSRYIIARKLFQSSVGRRTSSFRCGCFGG